MADEEFVPSTPLPSLILRLSCGRISLLVRPLDSPPNTDNSVQTFTFATLRSSRREGRDAGWTTDAERKFWYVSVRSVRRPLIEVTWLILPVVIRQE